MSAINSFDKYSKKKVSYVLVTKNRDKLLDKSLQKIKKLVTKDDELIVIDGGSSDNTLKVIRKHKSLVDKLVSESDLMPSHAGNKGLLLAGGKYIKMLTDDDVIYPEAMSQAVKLMDNNPEIDILECGGTRYRKSTKKLETIYRPANSNYPNNPNDPFVYGINVMGVLIRRSSLAKIGLFPLTFLADIQFLINALHAKAIVKFARIKLYHQYISDNTITANRELLGPLYFKIVKDYAPKLFYYRFAFNWFIQNHMYLRPFVLPFITPVNLLKKYYRFNQNKKKNKVSYVWDGGLS